MQAIILAAGMGKRLGEYTKDNTKCMVEVNGIKLIDRVIRQLGKLHLDRLVLVVGYQGQKLKDYIGNRYDDVIRIEFIENPVYDKTNNIYSLALAKEKLCEDDTLLLESDILFEDRVLESILENPYPNLALVDKYETWMDGTMVCLNEKNEIVNFVPKAAFRYEDVDTYYKTVNVYKLSKEFSRDVYIPFLEAYSRVMGNNEYYEQVLRVITYLHRSELRALPLNGEKWYEIDDAQDLDIASTLFSDDENKYQEYSKRKGGYWRFPQLTNFCNCVNPYFPTKRMLDEMRANFDTLTGEYPSGADVNSLIAGKNLGIRQKYVAVGNGTAEILDVVTKTLLQGKRTGVTSRYYEELAKEKSNGQAVELELGNEYTASEIKKSFSEKNLDVLLLVNPDTFSGNYIAKDDVKDIADWCERNGKKFIVDESFIDFANAEDTMLRNEMLEQYPSMMVIRSISKSCGVPGLRLSVLASGDEDAISRVKDGMYMWNINSIAEFYLQIFSKYESDYKDSCQKLIKERCRFYKDLQTIEYLRVTPSSANSFLCEVTGTRTSEELAKDLLRQNIQVYAVDGCIRIAVRTKSENERLVKVLSTL